MTPGWDIAGIGFLGVLIGSVIALAGTVWVARINANEAKESSHRTYLMGLMQQLIEARMEYEYVARTGGRQHDDFVKPVARAIAIASALGDSDVSNMVTGLAAKPMDEIGLTIIEYVIQRVSARINKLGGV